MAFETAKAYLDARGFGDRVKEFNVSSATVELAAEALGCPPAYIAKTLAFAHEEGAVLVVAAGDARVQNGKFKAQFGHKATMLSPDDTLRLVGHGVGGVCPFGVNETAAVYLDVSLKRFETVYPACGSSNSAVRLTPDELEELTGAPWVDVCKEPEEGTEGA